MHCELLCLGVLGTSGTVRIETMGANGLVMVIVFAICFFYQLFLCPNKSLLKGRLVLSEE